MSLIIEFQILHVVMVFFPVSLKQQHFYLDVLIFGNTCSEGQPQNLTMITITITRLVAGTTIFFPFQKQKDHYLKKKNIFKCKENNYQVLELKSKPS